MLSQINNPVKIAARGGTGNGLAIAVQLPREDSGTEPSLIIGKKVFKSLYQPVNDKSYDSTNDDRAYPEGRIVRKDEHSTFSSIAQFEWSFIL